MKTLFTLLMLVLALTAGIISYLLFVDSNYYESALLTVGWYVSLSLLITLLGSRKLILQS